MCVVLCLSPLLTFLSFFLAGTRVVFVLLHSPFSLAIAFFPHCSALHTGPVRPPPTSSPLSRPRFDAEGRVERKSQQLQVLLPPSFLGVTLLLPHPLSIWASEVRLAVVQGAIANLAGEI